MKSLRDMSITSRSANKGILYALCLLIVAALCGCGASGPPQEVQPPVGGLTAALSDEVHDLPGDRIAWTTYWQLCWAPYPSATAYELQPVTGEGTASRLIRQQGTCFRQEAAKGENAKADGLVNRDLLVKLQIGQLAYKVRAALSGNRVSAWSPPAAVGETATPHP
jgi:hypothetical protein